MIFEFGFVKTNIECPSCFRVHHDVQLGEEEVFCACGACIFMSRIGEDKIVYSYLRLEAGKAIEEERVNSDARNLC